MLKQEQQKIEQHARHVISSQKTSPTTVSQHHRVLREALQHALELEMIVRNPCDASKPPRKVKHKLSFLPEETANKIIELFRDTYPVFLAVTTGARRAEILGLKWQDVDLNDRVINIKRGLYITKEAGLFFKKPKNKTSKRAVAISPEVVKVLKKYKAIQNAAKLAAGNEYQANNLVCCLPNGEPINPSPFLSDSRKWSATQVIRHDSMTSGTPTPAIF